MAGVYERREARSWRTLVARSIGPSIRAVAVSCSDGHLDRVCFLYHRLCSNTRLGGPLATRRNSLLKPVRAVAIPYPDQVPSPRPRSGIPERLHSTDTST